MALKIHKKSGFQPNEKIFAESCSIRYKDLLRAKKFFGVIGTLMIKVQKSGILQSCVSVLFMFFYQS